MIDATLLYAFLCLLGAHWIADFILQTDWQAKNKSTNNAALTEHVVTYTAAMAIPSFALFYIVTEHPTGAVICFFWLFGNGIAHWCTDFVTSRVNTYLYKKGDTHNFFVCIGFDQWIHHITLGLSFAYAINLTMRTG